MTFGPEKISAPKVLDSILEVIKDELMKQDSFANTSLAYYGIELSFKVDLKLHARKETHVVIEKDAPVLGAKTDDEPKEVTVKGKRVAGRKIENRPGSHLRDREGAEVS